VVPNYGDIGSLCSVCPYVVGRVQSSKACL